MACDLIKTGRNFPCKSIAGIRAFYFLGLAEGSWTVDAATGIATDFLAVASPTPATAYKYHIRSASNVIQTLTGSTENRTLGLVEQVATGILHRMDHETNVELKLMAQSNPLVIAHLNTGESILLGLEYGMDIITAVADTGSGQSEFAGYTLTISGQERDYGVYIQGSVLDNPFGGIDTPAEIAVALDSTNIDPGVPLP